MTTLTPEQDFLADYAYAVGMTGVEGVLFVVELWEPEATIEMLHYIADTREKNPNKLLEVASQISRKYKCYEEEFEDEDWE